MNLFVFNVTRHFPKKWPRLRLKEIMYHYLPKAKGRAAKVSVTLFMDRKKGVVR